MNETNIMQSPFHTNSLETIISTRSKNIPQSFSSSQLMKKSKMEIQNQELNNRTETSTIINSSILNDYYSLHTSKLSSSISLINKQMSNMMINKKHSSKIKAFKIECVHFTINGNNNSISENILNENERLKQEIEQLKSKLREEKNKIKNDKKKEENTLIFQLAQDINNLKEEISKNNIRYKEIKNEYDQIFNENMMLKRENKELREVKNKKSQNNMIINEKEFEIIQKNNNMFEKESNNTYISSVTNNITETTGNIQTTTSRNISFLNDNNEKGFKEQAHYNYYSHNNQIIPLYSKKRIASLANNTLNQTSFTTFKKQKKPHEASVFGEISNQRNRNYPIIEKKVSLSQKKITLHKDLENYKIHFDNTNSISNNIIEGKNTLLNSNNPNNKEVFINNFNFTTIKKEIQTNNSNAFLKKSMNQLFRIDYSNKRILSFDLKSHKYNSSLYKDTCNFNSIYQSNGSSFLSTYTNFYIITGLLFNAFYIYCPKEHTIIQLSSLSFSHQYSMMISFGADKIICISGMSTSSVEEYSISNNNWTLYPSLHNYRANSNCLIQNNTYLYVSFGYDYHNLNYLSTIERLSLENPTEWKILQVDFSIKYHSSFVTTEAKEENTTIFIVGGCYGEENKSNMDLIELKMKEDECTVIHNTQKERVKKNNSEYQFLFSQSFVDYFDNESNSWKKCGFDNKGDIHIIDVVSLKHKILNFKGTQ